MNNINVIPDYKKVVIKPIGLGRCAVIGNNWSIAFSNDSVARTFIKQKNLVITDSIKEN